MRTIQGYVGETVTELLQQNQESMNLARRHDDSPIIFPDNDLSDDIFHFTYNQPGAEIHIPTARLIWFTQYAGVITEVSVDTSSQKGTLVDLFGQLFGLRKSLIEAHWEEVKPIGTYNELQAIIARSEGTTNSFGTGKYKKGNVEAIIMLTIPGEVITPEKTSQATFIAEIWFHDEVLGGEQYAKMQAARIKAHGNDTSLPMSYWVQNPVLTDHGK